MRAIAKPRLRAFWEEHPNAQAPLKAWWKIVTAKDTDWSSIADVKATFANADGFALPCGVPVVVFNIGGNKYRLVARIDYRRHTVYIKKVMTHREYDRNAWKDQICRGQL